MNQYRPNYREVCRNELQRSFEFSEYPQLQDYYPCQMSSYQKKPRKIIITEIYDELIPKNKNNIKNHDYFNYYSESSSPFNNHQRNFNTCQKKIFSRDNYYLTEKRNPNYLSNVDGYYSDFNKQLFFGGTDLREEYSSPSNNRINIRKKVYRGGTPQHLFRNNYSLNNDEDFVENFQYYESKNIKDKNNRKYDSITRVTGYSNLIPLTKKKLEHNYTNMDIYRNEDSFNNISSSRYSNFKQLQHNYSNVDVYKNNSLYNLKNKLYEPKKPQSEEKIKRVLQKTTEVYENQKTPQTIAKNINIIKTTKSTNEQNIQKKINYQNTQKTTTIQKTITKKTNVQNVPKISTNIQTTTTKSTNVQNVDKKTNVQNLPRTTNVQTKITKYEFKKAPQPEKKVTNVQVQNITTKKYEVQKKPETVAKETNISNVSSYQSQNITKKSEAYKSLQNTSKTITTNIKVQKENTNKNNFKNNIKIKIDTSKYNNPNNEKLYFKRSHGRYTYKESLSERDILNSRKNDKTENIKKVEIIQKNKAKENKKISNSNNRSNIGSKVSSYKKVETTSKTLLNNKKVNQNTYNTSNAKSRETITLKSTKNTLINKPVNNLSKTTVTSTNLKSINSNMNKNKETASNYSNKNYNIKNNIKIETYNEGLNTNKYKKEYIKTENQRKDISNQYLTNINIEKKKKESSNQNLADINLEKKRKELANQYTNIKIKSQRTDISDDYLNRVNSGSNIYNDRSNIYDDRNKEYIEEREINQIYEIEQRKKKETTPKLRTKVLGDNYKYYERKYIPSPGEIISINSYTLHQRRNERVILGTEEIGGTELMRSYKMRPHTKGYKAKSKKIVKRKVMPIHGAPNKYIAYADFYEDSYNYGGDGEDFEVGYQSNFGQPQYYFQ